MFYELILNDGKTDLLRSDTLTFYGGLDKIGGNKILLEDKDTMIFLDFELQKVWQFFEGNLKPHVARRMSKQLCRDELRSLFQGNM